MSTGSTIQIMSKLEDKTVILYKHYDGYLSDTLPILKTCFDNSLTFNQFIKRFSKEYGRDLKEIVSSGSEKTYSYDKYLYKSENYCQHGDLEYFYIVDINNKTIKAYGESYGTESDLVYDGLIDVPLNLRTSLIDSGISINTVIKKDNLIFEKHKKDIERSTQAIKEINKKTLPTKKVKNSFTAFVDSGHAWLKVPFELLKNMGLAETITEYSYYKKGNVYLEEDCDWREFAIRYKALYSKDIKVNEKYSVTSRVRTYFTYMKPSEYKKEQTIFNRHFKVN